jgi:hypothetical protein
MSSLVLALCRRTDSAAASFRCTEDPAKMRDVFSFLLRDENDVVRGAYLPRAAAAATAAACSQSTGDGFAVTCWDEAAVSYFSSVEVRFTKR